MTTVSANLADIYLPTSLGDLLTVPGGETWVVTSVVCGSSSATPQTIQLWVRIAGVDSLLTRALLNQNYSLSSEGGLVLPPGAKVRGVATSANTVRTVISGYKVT